MGVPRIAQGIKKALPDMGDTQKRESPRELGAQSRQDPREWEYRLKGAPLEDVREAPGKPWGEWKCSKGEAPERPGGAEEESRRLGSPGREAGG